MIQPAPGSFLPKRKERPWVRGCCVCRKHFVYHGSQGSRSKSLDLHSCQCASKYVFIVLYPITWRLHDDIWKLFWGENTTFLNYVNKLGQSNTTFWAFIQQASENSFRTQEKSIYSLRFVASFNFILNYYQCMMH